MRTLQGYVRDTRGPVAVPAQRFDDGALRALKGRDVEDLVGGDVRGRKDRGDVRREVVDIGPGDDCVCVAYDGEI